MREVTVKLTLADPTGGDATDEVDVLSALGDLIGVELTDEDGISVEVFTAYTHNV